MKQRSKRTLSLLAPAAFLLAGCRVEIVHPFGNEVARMIETQSVTGKEEQTLAGVETAMYRSFAVFQTGDSKAFYSMLSRDCRRSAGNSLEYGLNFERKVWWVETLSGWKLAEMRLIEARVVDFTPTRATVASTYDLGDGTISRTDDDPAVFVYENGRWKSECDE